MTGLAHGEHVPRDAVTDDHPATPQPHHRVLHGDPVQAGRHMTTRPPVLVRVLNNALGLELADFTEARVFLRSPEGNALLEAWLDAHRGDDE